jgi:uncharacterized protein (TIGR02466 family)
MANKQTNIDSLLEKGVRLLREGAFADAEKVFQKVLLKVPREPTSLEALAVILMERGNLSAAIEKFNEALQSGSERPDLHYNLGNAYAAGGLFSDAATAYRRAVELEDEFIEAWFNLAEVLEKLDRLQGSIDAYEKVLELDADLAPALTNLGCVLTEAGRLDEAIAAFKKSIELEPAFPPTHTNLGKAHKYAGALEPAIAAHREAIRLAPGYADAHYNLGTALSIAGEFGEAEKTFHSALKFGPSLSRAKLALGAAQIGLGKAEAAIGLCDAASPDDCEMLALKSFAMAAHGLGDEARAFIDYDRFVNSFTLLTPSGYGSLEVFNDRLVEHILEHPTLAHAPTSHATVNGQHTGNMLIEPKGPFADFEKALWQAVGSYQKELSQLAGHPFRGDRELAELVVWAIVMESGGYQVPHIHPTGWISGVYYPRLPAFEAATKVEDSAGCLEFGTPPPDIPFDGEPYLKTVQPEEGMLVLFPSFFYHRTIPFEAEAARVSIAFDFRPAVT